MPRFAPIGGALRAGRGPGPQPAAGVADTGAVLEWIYAPACAGCDVRWDGPFCEACAISVDELGDVGAPVAGVERLVAPLAWLLTPSPKRPEQRVSVAS